MLTLDQVNKLKQARAAFEVLPLVVWTPFLLFMLPRCLYANTRERVAKVVLYGIIGVTGCELASRSIRDHYYWPVVANVYRELIAAEQERRDRHQLSLANMQLMFKTPQ
jgi:hypothetical protein